MKIRSTTAERRSTPATHRLISARQPRSAGGALTPIRRTFADAAITSRGAVTRARILQTAGELITRRGVDATTIDGICHTSLTSKSQLYQHFTGKEDLVRSVVDERARQLLSRQRQEWQAVDSVAALQEWRDNLVSANRQRSGAFGCVLGTMVSQLADRDEHVRIQLAAHLAEWRHLAAVALRRLQTSGQLRRDADPDALATGLIGALQGGYILAQASRNVDDMAVAIDMALSRIRSFAIEGH